MSFQIDWVSLVVGSKFTVLALFYFVFEGNFPSTEALGGLMFNDRFNGGFFLRYRFGGLIFEGAYTWRGLFSEFYSILVESVLFSGFKTRLSSSLLTLYLRVHIFIFLVHIKLF